MDDVLKILKNNRVCNIDDVCKKLNNHLNCVLETNKYINLTAITNLNEAKLLHIEDSLIPLHYILGIFKGEKCDNVKYADIGSGAGYPGIPIGVASSFNTTLIETTKKKADFLKNFIIENKLENFNIINDRIENVGRDHFECFDLITARALANLSSLLELASPLCKIGGYLVCYKAVNCDKENEDASQVESVFGFKKHLVKDFALSDGITSRKIITYKKIGKASIKLPRKLGIAQKRPYKIK